MIFDYIIYGLVSLLASLASFYLTNNFYFLIGTLLVFALYFIIYEVLFKHKERGRLKRNRDLTIFIHDFFLVYNIDFSLEKAINAAQEKVSPSLKEAIKMLDEFKCEDKLERLGEYFSSSLYQLFLKTIDLCEHYSEDRVKTISFLLEENNRYVLNQSSLQKSIWRSLVEFSLLWIVSFLILIIIRFAVNNYFSKIITSWIYLAGIAIYFVFFLFSIHLFMQATHRRIKQYEQ